jgi:hypothetical protein
MIVGKSLMAQLQKIASGMEKLMTLGWKKQTGRALVTMILAGITLSLWKPLVEF